MKDIKIGDLVEDCSLMPGVVMKIEGDDIRIRRLDFDDYRTMNGDFSHCSLKHCGIVKITSQQALNRLALGKEELTKIWDKHQSIEEYYKEIDKTS